MYVTASVQFEMQRNTYFHKRKECLNNICDEIRHLRFRFSKENAKNELNTLDFVTSKNEFIMSQRRNWRAKFWIFRRSAMSNIDILASDFPEKVRDGGSN